MTTQHTRGFSAQEKINWIRLSRSENVGKSTFFRLIKIFGSASAALEKISDCAVKGGLGRQIKVCSLSEAEKELANSTKFGAQIIAFGENDYPNLLREIADPAPILTLKGHKELLNNHKIAVVGPRNASFNGIAFARKIAAELGENSLIVASGMARGIDAAAHQASLKTGTIAVIAGGIDHIYPKENTELYHKIADQGLLLCESPFGAPPKGGNFIQRNRIISGISLGVVVVEAGLKSGSLVTARFALEQGREIFAVPGSPFDPRCHGTNRLIKQGAKLTENIDDILEEISSLKARFAEVGMLQEPEAEEFIMPLSKMPDEKEIAEIRKEIIAKISFVPIAIEAIIQELSASARAINVAIVQLELADKVEVVHGKVVRKMENFQDY